MSLGQDGHGMPEKEQASATAASLEAPDTSALAAAASTQPKHTHEAPEGQDTSAPAEAARTNKQGAVYAAINRKTTFELQD